VASFENLANMTDAEKVAAQNTKDLEEKLYTEQVLELLNSCNFMHLPVPL
jgi:hypothetical protein